MALTADQEGMFTDLETEDNSEPISFEYDLNESDQKVLLGKGIYFKSRVPLFFFIWPLGPKFLKKFRWFFGRNDGTNKTFWN